MKTFVIIFLCSLHVSFLCGDDSPNVAGVPERILLKDANTVQAGAVVSDIELCSPELSRQRGAGFR